MALLPFIFLGWLIVSLAWFFIVRNRNPLQARAEATQADEKANG